LKDLRLPSQGRFVHDQFGHPAVLFHSLWGAEYAERENPKIGFSEIRVASSALDLEPNLV
jgi:hypothetical protein